MRTMFKMIIWLPYGVVMSGPFAIMGTVIGLVLGTVLGIIIGKFLL